MSEPLPEPPPEDPPPPYTIERRDASTVEQWDVPSRTYRRYEHGELVIERAFTEAEIADADTAAVEATRRTNRAELLSRARTAYAADQAYLDLVAGGSATQADHIAQIAALTRQMRGLIRLAVGADLLDQLTES